MMKITAKAYLNGTIDITAHTAKDARIIRVSIADVSERIAALPGDATTISLRFYDRSRNVPITVIREAIAAR